ncbi:hypothetical protein B0H19DRAFT_1264980 [Mycena capillaripes]|nr:hypothetical protein B0H19DRAFT_1264980 [Mycena capillaripes]
MACVLPEEPLYGHYSLNGQLYTVHSGSPDIVLRTPTPQEAPPIDQSTLIPFFRHPRYLLLNYVYLLFVPKHYAWRNELFKTLDRPRHKVPIIMDGDNGFCLHPDVAETWMDLENCLRALGMAMIELAPQRWLAKVVSSWFFPARFKFLHKFRTEQAARFAAWRSIENFLPLLGYVSMGLWCMHCWENQELARGADRPDWWLQVTQKSGIHPTFLDYVEGSVAGNWNEEHVEGLYCIQPPAEIAYMERESRGDVEWVLGTILRSKYPIPIYLSWGKLPKEISFFDVPEAFQALVPDAGELAHLAAARWQMKFSRWSVDNETLSWYRDPYTPPSGPARRPREKGCGSVKSNRFFWEEQDGHYIRQAGGRGNYEELWSEYPRSQRRIDPIANEWDLCDLFKDNDPVFGEDYVDDPPSDDDDDDDDKMHPTFPQDIDMASRLPREGNDTEILQQQHPHDLEMALIEDVPGDDDLGPDFAESAVPKRNLVEASRNCVNWVYLKFGLAPRTGKLVYEPIADNLLDALSMRFGFTMPPSLGSFVARDPPSRRLDTRDLANVISMGDIGNQLAAHNGLVNVLGTFFGQCFEACSAQDIDKNLLDYHQPQRAPRPPSTFEIGREYLTSMRDPSEQSYYYVLCQTGSGIGSEVLLIPRATDLLEVLRRPWREIKEVVGHFLARGIPFWLAYVSAEIMPAAEKSTPTALRPKRFKADTTFGLGFRPYQYTFDVFDYQAYTTQRDIQVLHTPRARIALQYGGIIARLARSEVSDEDFLRGFDEAIYDVGDCLWDGTSQHAYWVERLSTREIDVLCGVYHVGTGQQQIVGKGKGKQEKIDTDQTTIVSWWPKPSAWACGGLDRAWWTPQCEEDFFQKCLGFFANGIYILHRQPEWRHNLKYRKDVKKCWDGYETVADSIAQGLIRSGAE